jgi:NADH-quinone oxidoreductase subunit N
MPPIPVPELKLNDFYYIAPEIFLGFWGLLVLVLDFGFLRTATTTTRRNFLGLLSLAGAVAALLLIFFDAPTLMGKAYTEPDPFLFFGTIAGNRLTSSMNVLVLLLLAGVLAVSMTWTFTQHWGEYYALVLWATVGMMLLIAAEDLITLFLTLETMTLCLYMIASFEKTRLRSAEAGLKYFVYGSVSSALFLFGLSLIYGLTGTTRLDAIRAALAGGTNPLLGLAGNLAGATAVLLVMVGFGFKIAAVPFHQWAPDTYEGAPAPVTAWIASGSKVASFIALMKVLVHALGPWSHAKSQLEAPGWIGVVAIIAAATMTYGNFAALAQRNLKRLLAYSSIAHAGYMLVGVLAAAVSVNELKASGAVLFYLVVYGVTTVGTFALAAWLVRDRNGEDIKDLNGFARQSPILAVCILILMLSLIGMPPFAGFFAKLYLFMEALDTRNPGHVTFMWLVALALANSVVSAFYYVRILKAMFLRAPEGRPIAPAPAGVSVPIVVATAVAVFFGIYPTPLLDTMQAAAIPIFTDRGGDRAPSTVPKKYVTDQDPRFRLTPEELEKREKRLIEESRNAAYPAPTGSNQPGAPPTPYRGEPAKKNQTKGQPKNESPEEPKAATKPAN